MRRRCLAVLVVSILVSSCAKGQGAPAPGGHTTGSAGSRSPASPSFARPTRSAKVITHGPRTQKEVALTFDADMTRSMLAELRSGRVSSWYNAGVVRELRATHTPATIFLTGLWVKTYPSVVRSLSADPLFELENHSWDHASFEPACFGLPSVSSDAAKKAEIETAAAEISLVAESRPAYFRFPGGCHSAADARLVSSLGEQPVGWDVVSGDAFRNDPRVIVATVLAGVRPGSIVVMHLHGGPNAPATDEALHRIIPALKKRGYTFVTLARLLG